MDGAAATEDQHSDELLCNVDFFQSIPLQNVMSRRNGIVAAAATHSRHTEAVGTFLSCLGLFSNIHNSIACSGRD